MSTQPVPDPDLLARLSREDAFAALFVRAARAILGERDAVVLIDRHGLLDGHARTLAELGDQHGITRERVRQLVKRSLNRLQWWAATQFKRGELDAPCAALAAYVRAAVRPDEPGEDERLWALLAADLPHLQPAGQGAPLVAAFLGDNEVVERRTAAIREIAARQADAGREVNWRARDRVWLDTLLQDAIWPPRILPVDDAAIGRFSAARSISPGASSETGFFYSGRLGRLVAYESGIERDFLQRLESVDSIRFFQEQPFRIPYDEDNRSHHYYPDIFFVAADGRGVVVEIAPPFEMAQKHNWAKWSALRAFCREHGYGLLVTDGRRTFQMVSHHPVRPEIRQALLATLAEGAMDWAAYQAWRKRWDITVAELYAIVIRERLNWQLKPFLLAAR